MSANLLMTQHEFAQQALVENGLLKCLTDGLRQTLAWDAQGDAFARKLSTLRFIFQSFQRHLERLMSLEEVDGYMDSVLEADPHLSKAVESLKRDHERFRQAAWHIADELAHLPATDPGFAVSVCDKLADLLDQLEEHGNQEAKLFLEAFEHEEGGEG